MALFFPGKNNCPICNGLVGGLKSIYGVLVARIK
jgi:hypothetical protein